jgi:hypothetical protein
MGTGKSVATERESAFAAALVALARAREKHTHVRPHRAINRLAMRPALLLQSLILILGFCGVLLVLKPQLFVLWRYIIEFWAGLLDMPLGSVALRDDESALGLRWTRNAGADLPSNATLALTALVTLVAFFCSFAMNGSALPLKYLVRILCAVQTLSLLFFWVAAAQFPYSVASHMRDMSTNGYVIMVAIPVLLSLGYYVLNIGVTTKVAHTVAILLFFVVLVPHQIVGHALILQHFSLLFMPLLYVCFGALFDMLVFIALYSWAASMAPPDAMT